MKITPESFIFPSLPPSAPPKRPEKKRVAFVTTCKGRLEHIRATLPKNINDSGANDAIFIVLDYNDQDGLADYIEREHKADLDSGKLIYYRNKDQPRFHMAHAKNQAHRCAIKEGADILVTLDADNLIGRGFTNFLLYKFETDPELSFVCPDFKTLPKPGHRFNADNPVQLGRGFAGRLAIRANDFIKAGGYNEVFETWRGEDIDLISRLDRLGLKKGFIDRIFLNAIAHSSQLRFSEYPDAKKFENEDMYAITENAHDTVVNNGVLGCGRVFRNFCSIPITLNPVPTRVFGIGMQRTGTTSLHEAFQMMGFDSAHWKSANWAKAIWQEMSKWGNSRTMEKDYALCDNPIPLLYEKLDKTYAGSKFILTVRDEDAWVRSVEKFWTYEGNPQRWTWDADGFSHKMHGMIYGTIEFDEQVFRERYRRHNAAVTQYFSGRSDFLRLEIDGGTTMAPLRRFLDLPFCGHKFPHSHRTNHKLSPG